MPVGKPKPKSRKAGEVQSARAVGGPRSHSSNKRPMLDLMSAKASDSAGVRKKRSV